MWETKTVVVIMTVNRAVAISVLWVQLKAVYSTSWGRLVLIRERNQKLLILMHTLTIDQLKHCNWLPCATQPAGRQNRNIISIIVTFSPVMYSFYDKILFPESSSLFKLPFSESCTWKFSNSHDCYFFMVKAL